MILLDVCSLFNDAVINTDHTCSVEWLVMVVCVEGSGHIMSYVWSHWGRQRNTSFVFFCVLAEVWIEDLPKFYFHLQIVLNFRNLQPALVQLKTSRSSIFVSKFSSIFVTYSLPWSNWHIVLFMVFHFTKRDSNTAILSPRFNHYCYWSAYEHCYFNNCIRLLLDIWVNFLNQTIIQVRDFANIPLCNKIAEEDMQVEVCSSGWSLV